MADFATQLTNGSQKTAAVAAGSGAADVVVTAKPGRICNLVITTAGSAAIALYDHATATSGAALLWISPATTVLGAVYTIDVPVSLGVVALQASGSPAVTIAFSEDAVSGSGKGRSMPTSTGGQYTSTHAAGSGGAAAALSAPGRLCSVVVLAQGTVATIIYDNTAASGTKLFSVPASGTTAVTAGTVYNINMPVTTGIYVGGATNTSQVLITYSKNDGTNGR